MPAVVDPTKMYLFFGGLGEFRTVGLVSVRNALAGGNDGVVTVNKAIRGKVKFAHLQATNGAYVRPEAMYSVPIALAPGPWKTGDLLTDSNEPNPVSVDGSATGITYTVQIAEHDEGFWLLSCFNPTIAFNLRDVSSVLLLSESRTSMGGRTVTDAPLQIAGNPVVNEPCRIQPTSSAWSISQGRVGDVNVFDIYYSRNMPLSANQHAISWTDADLGDVVADIKSIDNQQRIDECMRATVEVRPQ